MRSDGSDGLVFFFSKGEKNSFFNYFKFYISKRKKVIRKWGRENSFEEVQMLFFRRIRPCLALSRSRRFFFIFFFFLFFYFFFSIGNEKGVKVIQFAGFPWLVFFPKPILNNGYGTMRSIYAHTYTYIHTYIRIWQQPLMCSNTPRPLLLLLWDLVLRCATREGREDPNWICKQAPTPPLPPVPF